MFTRAGQEQNIKWEEQQTLEDAGISDQELDKVLEDYQNSDSMDFYQKKQEYLNEKAREGLNSGKGSFRRG